jgi:hypothetical protein
MENFRSTLPTFKCILHNKKFGEIFAKISKFV